MNATNYSWKGLGLLFLCLYVDVQYKGLILICFWVEGLVGYEHWNTVDIKKIDCGPLKGLVALIELETIEKPSVGLWLVATYM